MSKLPSAEAAVAAAFLALRDAGYTAEALCLAMRRIGLPRGYSDATPIRPDFLHLAFEENVTAAFTFPRETGEVLALVAPAKSATQREIDEMAAFVASGQVKKLPAVKSTSQAQTPRKPLAPTAREKRLAEARAIVATLDFSDLVI